MSLFLKSGLRTTLRSLPLACSIFLLAISIFGWGLHSKLSLYGDHAEAQVAVPTAKLISEQERPASVRASHSIAPPSQPTPLAAVALWSFLAAVPRPVERLWPRRSIITVKPVAFCFNGPSLLRPPPFTVA